MDSIQVQRLITNIPRCLGNRLGVIVIHKAQIWNLCLSLPATGKLQIYCTYQANRDLLLETRYENESMGKTMSEGSANNAVRPTSQVGQEPLRLGRRGVTRRGVT